MTKITSYNNQFIEFGSDVVEHYINMWYSKKQPCPCTYTLIKATSEIPIKEDQQLTAMGSDLKIHTYEGKGWLYEFDSTKPSDKLYKKSTTDWFEIVQKDLEEKDYDGYCLWGECHFGEPIPLSNSTELLGDYVFLLIREGESEPNCSFIDLNDISRSVKTDPEIMATFLQWTDFP